MTQTETRPRPGRTLTGEQAGLVADFYPYALAIADRRASSSGCAWLGDRLRDDATTELFRAARKYIGRDGTPFRGYLGDCLRLKLSDTNIGRKARHGRVAGLHDGWAAVRPDTSVDDADAFEGLIRPLPARYRDVLRMFYRDDMTPGEVGKAIGIKGSGADAIRVRAVARLRAGMGVPPGGPGKSLREAS